MAWVAEIMTFIAAYLCFFTKFQEDLFISEDIKKEKSKQIQNHLLQV